MNRSHAVAWNDVINELANALQAAIGIAGEVRTHAQTTIDEAVMLEASLARAVMALRTLRATQGPRRDPR
jgi:hypothetical protein